MMRGQIAGYGQFADGVYHSFLLTPAGPLTVSDTNPAPDTIFSPPAMFLVSASGTDMAGTVTNVQFLVNGSVIGEGTSVPDTRRRAICQPGDTSYGRGLRRWRFEGD